MHEDTTSSHPSEQSEANTDSQSAEHLAKHRYYEVGTELMAKPGLLCDLIESEGTPRTLIFCNAPSDADFVDVILKKRGISSRKLIGHVPHHKISRSLAEFEEGQTSALVLTDVSAESIKRIGAGLVINHSVPSDPDVYLDRLSKIANPKDLLVVSFVGPLDFSNFHFLKKVVENEFVKLDPPSYQEVAKRRLLGFAENNKSAAWLNDEKVKLFAGLFSDSTFLSAEQREIVLAGLVNAFLNPPAASAGPAQHSEGDRGPRRDRHSHRRDRGDEGEMEGNGFSDMGEPREGRHERRERRGPAPKDARLYIGQGKDKGYGQADFVNALKSALEGSSVEWSDALVKRFTQRELYCFVDIADEVAQIALPKLKEAGAGGDKLVVCNAVSIPQQRAQGEEEGESNGRHGRYDRRQRSRGNSFDDSEEDRGNAPRRFGGGDDEEE